MPVDAPRRCGLNLESRRPCWRRRVRSQPRMMVAVTASTFATAIVAVLGGLFALLLAGSFRRARISRTHVPRPAPSAGEHTLGAGPHRSARVLSRRDFFRGSLLASLGVFAAQFGGTTLAFLWPNLKGGFGSQITLTDPPDAILQQVVDGQQPYYLGAGRFYLISYTGDGDGFDNLTWPHRDRLTWPHPPPTVVFGGVRQRTRPQEPRRAPFGRRVGFWVGEITWPFGQPPPSGSGARGSS